MDKVYITLFLSIFVKNEVYLGLLLLFPFLGYLEKDKIKPNKSN